MRLNRLLLLSVSLIFLILIILIVLAFTKTSNQTILTESPTQMTVTQSSTQRAPILIGEIQGTGHRSPFEGKRVEGIQCIITYRIGNGFYCQDAIPDGNDKTSDGIFVSSSLVMTLKNGMLVEVSGVVDEVYPGGLGSNDLPTTMIVQAEVKPISEVLVNLDPVIVGGGGRFPPTRVIDDDGLKVYEPDVDGIDFYESLEGMLVEVKEGRVVSSTNDYREFAIVPGCRGCGLYTSTGGIMIQEDDQNPERILIDDAFTSISPKQYGTLIQSPIKGIVTYGYENFRINPIKDFQTTKPSDYERFTRLNEKSTTIATYNVENLSDKDILNRIDGLAKQIVDDLNSPDILNLVEVMDSSGVVDDGTVDSETTLQALTSAIKNCGGPDYGYVYIHPGNNMDGGILGGNIRNVILFRMDKEIDPVLHNAGDKNEAALQNINGNPVLTTSPALVKPKSGSFNQSRKPLVVEMKIAGKQTFIISVHLNSKGPDQGLFGLMQPPQTPSTGQRTNQATLVNRFVKEILAISPEARIIVLGDFNDFPFSEALRSLDSVQSATRGLDPDARYSFVYEGNSQLLDDIYLSKTLYNGLIAAKIVHLNTSQTYQYQLSDHDAVVIEIDN